MWNQEVLSVGDDEIGYRVDVVFYDNKTKCVKTYYPKSLSELQNAVQKELDERNGASTLEIKIPTGQPLDLTPEAGTPDTPEERARKDFQAKLDVLVQLKAAVKFGFKDENDQEYIDAVKAVKADYANYLPMLAAYSSQL